MQHKSGDALFAQLRTHIAPALRAASHTTPPSQTEAQDSSSLLQEAHHPDDELLDAYRQGWISGPLQQDLRVHLVTCPPCRERFAQLHLDAYDAQTPDISEQTQHEDSQATEMTDVGAKNLSPPKKIVSATSQPHPRLTAVRHPRRGGLPHPRGEGDGGRGLQGHMPDLTQTAPTLGEPEEAQTPSSPSSSPPSLFGMPVSSLSRWMGAFVGTGLTGLLLWLVVPSMWPQFFPKPNLTEGIKGARPPWVKGVENLYPDFEARAILHLGVSDGPGKPIRRLHREQPCHRQQSLFFGFSLAMPGGYVYLFRIDPKGQTPPELLYPFSPSASIHLKGGDVHIVQQQNITQKYPLESESKDVLFVLIQTQMPLSPAQQQQIIQQKSGWDESLRAIPQAGLATPLSFDRFLVKIQAKGTQGTTP